MATPPSTNDGKKGVRPSAVMRKSLEAMALAHPMDVCGLFTIEHGQIWPRENIDISPTVAEAVEKAWREGAANLTGPEGGIVATRFGDVGVFVRQAHSAFDELFFPLSALEASNEFVFVIDTDGIIVADLPTVARKKLKTASDFTGMSIWELDTASQADDSLRRIRNVCATGIAETSQRLSQVEYKRAHISNYFARIDENHALVISRDETSRVRYDEYERYVALLLESIPYRIYVLDRYGNYQTDIVPGQVNTTFFGGTLEGRSVKEFLPDDEAENAIQRIKQVLESGTNLNYTREHFEVATETTVEINVTLVKLDEDHVMSIVRRLEGEYTGVVHERLRKLTEMLLNDAADEFYILDSSLNILEQVSPEKPGIPYLTESYAGMVPEEEFRELQGRVAEVLRTKEPQSYVRRIATEGKIDYFDCRILPMAETAVGLQVKNANERYGEKLERKAIAEFAERLIFSIPDWIRILDRHGKFVQQFDAGPTKPKSPFGPVVGKTIYEVANREAANDTFERIQRVLRTGEVEQYFRTSHHLGQDHTLDIRMMRLDDDHIISLTRDVTESARLQTQVAKAEAGQRAILSSVPDLLVVIDRNSLTTDYHSGKVESFFLNPQAKKEVPIAELYPEPFHDVAQAQVDEVLLTGQPCFNTLTCVLQGVPRSYDVRTVPVDEDRVLQIWQDITDETLVRQRADRFFALSQECSLVCDANWMILKASSAFAQLVGLSLSNLIGSNFLEYVHPSDRLRSIRHALRVIKRGHPEPFIVRMKAADGSTRQFSWSAEWDREFQISYSVGRDVTQELAQAWLLEKTQLIGQIGGWRLDLVTGETWVTPGWKQLHDLPEDFEATIQNIETLYGSPLKEFISSSLNEWREGRPHIAINSLTTANGRVIWTETISEVEMINGAPGALFGTTRDITLARQAEEALTSMNKVLEHRVEHRTAALQAANHQLESFAHSVSHDLRAPLRSISSYSLFLEQDLGEIPPDARQHLDKIRGAITRMDTLISDILKLARIGHQEINREPVAISRLAQEVFESITDQKPSRKFAYEIEPDLIVWADKALVQIALENLLGNAVKFSEPKESPLIQVRGETIDGQVWITVADNGVGFDARYADQVFRDFSRLHRQDQFPGSGVGLGIVRRIVELHGGQIEASGEVNIGATFRMNFGRPLP